MPYCDSCNSHVSNAFARLARREDGEIPHCVNCVPQSKCLNAHASYKTTDREIKDSAKYSDRTWNWKQYQDETDATD